MILILPRNYSSMMLLTLKELYRQKQKVTVLIQSERHFDQNIRSVLSLFFD